MTASVVWLLLWELFISWFWLVSCACGLFGLSSAAATFMTLVGL